MADHSVALWTLLVFDRWAAHHLASTGTPVGGGAG